MKRILLLFALATFVSQASIRIVTLADIAGDAAAHAVVAIGFAHWISVSAAPENTTTNCGSSAHTACVFTGDSNISTSRGQWIVPGGSFLYAPVYGATQANFEYDLTTVYYLAPVGAKVTITYGY